MTTLRSRGYAAMISGAGPSVVVLGRDRHIRELAEQAAPGFQNAVVEHRTRCSRHYGGASSRPIRLNRRGEC